MTDTDIQSWLAGRGLNRFQRLFEQHAIDLDVLTSLTDADLSEMGIALGDRRRILGAIKGIAPVPTKRDGDTTERCQVTVLFCDLVGFTHFADQLDPEDLAPLTKRYMTTCQTVVERWGGHIANYMGDGLMAYFGWPQAHEDAAARAVFAGLDIVRDVAQLIGPDDAPLAARVGLSTGIVLVGQKMGEGELKLDSIFGTPPNLAARLEALAEPGEVLADAATRALVGDLQVMALQRGPQAIRGFRDPVEVFALRSPPAVMKPRRPLDWVAPVGRPAVVGRDDVLDQMTQLLTRMEPKQPATFMHVEGEAGIGKSHLVTHFLRQCDDEGLRVVPLQCWEYHSQSPMTPVIDYLNTKAGASPEASVADRKQAFERLALESRANPSLFVEDLGDLLGLAEKPEGVGPGTRRKCWYQALGQGLQALSFKKPLVMLIEDMHWADTATIDFLHYLAGLDKLNVFVLTTGRPGFCPDWADAERLDIRLKRLSASASDDLVRGVAATAELDETLLAQIVAASDGVPLFAAELTRAVLSQGSSALENDRLDIPPTLQGVLMARLASTGSAKPVAQFASCLGRVFHREVLHAASGQSARNIDEALNTLVNCHILEPAEGDQPGMFGFAHALLQEQAYESQPKSRRKTAHAAIARVLQSRPNANPLVLASHLTAAGSEWEAAQAWRKAAEAAVRKSAHREAVSLYSTALELVRKVPDQDGAILFETQVLLALGPLQLSLEGYGAETVQDIYDRARELSEQLNDPKERFTALGGQWLFHHMRAEYGRAAGLAKELVALATGMGAWATLEAQRATGATAFLRGDLATARRSFRAAIADPEQAQGSEVSIFGDTPRLACLCYLASTEWMMGNQVGSSIMADSALEDAVAHDQPFSLARALSFNSFTLHLQREFEALMELTDRCIQHSDKHEFPFHGGVARILKGWALVETGEPDGGRVLLDEGLDQYHQSKSRMLKGWFTTLSAEAALGAGDINQAQHLLDQADALIIQSGETISRPEVLRVQGRLARQTGDDRAAAAAFEDAYHTARRINATALALRAAELWREVDPEAEAHVIAARKRLDVGQAYLPQPSLA
ncbi:AAA family ATPase [Shimia ponticola]|uniref:AAA family ATPase n=1 Tax=Shimia ponticola TaxID=2582893 RepID=UPI0011BE8390|nr:adenylate/guanylate cyclase domain-containing protein [Shimia ponticola]